MEINIWQVLFQVINFGVILFVLNKILYKPVLKLLDDRAKKINEGQAMAEKNLKEAAELDKVRKTELAKVRKEASAIISNLVKKPKKKPPKLSLAGLRSSKTPGNLSTKKLLNWGWRWLPKLSKRLSLPKKSMALLAVF